MSAWFSARGHRTSGTRSRAGRRRHLPRTPSRGTAGPPLPRLREVEELDALHPHDPSSPTAWIGSAVSQDTLDACFLPDEGKPRCRSFAHDPAGQADWLAWAEAGRPAEGPLGFGLESTGAYGPALANALAAGRPARPHRQPRPQPVRRPDARPGQPDRPGRGPAHRRVGPTRTAPRLAPAHGKSPCIPGVAASPRRPAPARRPREGTAGGPRLDVPATQRSIRRTVTFVAKEADRRQEQADDLIAAAEALTADRDLLESIPGSGTATAAPILGELPDPTHCASAQQAAAYAGWAPREYRSGTSVRQRTRLSKAGQRGGGRRGTCRPCTAMPRPSPPGRFL